VGTAGAAITLRADAALVYRSVAIVVEEVIAVLLRLRLHAALAIAPLAVLANPLTLLADAHIDTAGPGFAGVTETILVGETITVVVDSVAGFLSAGMDVRTVVVAIVAGGATLAQVAIVVFVQVGAVGSLDTLAVAADVAIQAIIALDADYFSIRPPGRCASAPDSDTHQDTHHHT
jgi:hypothetical protein